MTDDLTRTRHAAAEAVLGWIAMNTGDPGHTVLSVYADDFLDLPEPVRAHLSYRLRSGGKSRPTFLMPAGILARYALGLEIPEPEPGA